MDHSISARESSGGSSWQWGRGSGRFEERETLSIAGEVALTRCFSARSNFSTASLLPLCHRPINVYTPQPVTRGDRHQESQRASSVLRAREDLQGYGLLWGCRTWHHLIKTMLPLISSLSSLGSSGSGLWEAVRVQLQRQINRWNVSKKKKVQRSLDMFQGLGAE